MSAKRFFTIDAFIWTLVVISQALSSSWMHNPNGAVSWKEKGFASAYVLASKLTDPISRAHQLYREAQLVETLYPTASPSEKWVRKNTMLLRASGYSLLSLFTILPGIELRLIAHSLQHHPYIHFTGDVEEKRLTNDSISLLMWNLCCCSGGYPITNGGVTPWSYRLPQIMASIRAQGADVVCLCEIFDIQAAMQLVKGLKDTYTHFYFNIGPNPIGFSSGLFVASKVEISDPEFTPFPNESFHGSGKLINKGFFSFDVKPEGQSAIRIFSTHLQHSEIAQNPKIEELNARKRGVELILDKMASYNDRLCVLTGDLNMADPEYYTSEWIKGFDKGIVEGTGYTWGGDQFCSALFGKPGSCALNLDHTLMTKNGGATLITSYVETGFDGATFNPEALSDHKGLFSIITFGPAN